MNWKMIRCRAFVDTHERFGSPLLIADGAVMNMKDMPTISRAIAATAAICILLPASGFANDEKADRLTQTALNMDAHPEAGKVQFERSCSRCHGQSGQGDDARQIPGLAGQRYAYLVRQMANFGAAERDNAAMYHILTETRLADPQAWNDIAAYLNRLPATGAPQTGDGGTVALGRGIFHEQCASCHRADASGDKEGFVPSLRNQHYRYLVSQLHRMAEGHRRNIDPSLVLFMRSFSEADIVAVSDYLSRQRGASRSHDHMLGNGVVVN
jgi:cytochrome c553